MKKLDLDRWIAARQEWRYQRTIYPSYPKPKLSFTSYLSITICLFSLILGLFLIIDGIVNPSFGEEVLYKRNECWVHPDIEHWVYPDSTPPVLDWVCGEARLEDCKEVENSEYLACQTNDRYYQTPVTSDAMLSTPGVEVHEQRAYKFCIREEGLCISMTLEPMIYE